MGLIDGLWQSTTCPRLTGQISKMMLMKDDDHDHDVDDDHDHDVDHDDDDDDDDDDDHNELLFISRMTVVNGNTDHTFIIV